MKRFHVHVGVHDLQQSVRFYPALFAAKPTVLKDDYAKWQLDDPRVNFAISTRAAKAGLDHLGIQAEDGAELEGARRKRRGGGWMLHSEDRASRGRGKEFLLFLVRCPSL
jgi:hypothetical protein